LAAAAQGKAVQGGGGASRAQGGGNASRVQGRGNFDRNLFDTLTRVPAFQVYNNMLGLASQPIYESGRWKPRRPTKNSPNQTATGQTWLSIPLIGRLITISGRLIR
jgi:hypothetical protein